MGGGSWHPEEGILSFKKERGKREVEEGGKEQEREEKKGRRRGDRKGEERSGKEREREGRRKEESRRGKGKEKKRKIQLKKIEFIDYLIQNQIEDYMKKQLEGI